MMDPARLTKMSKYLSKHLRHQPERLGLSLSPGGWVTVAALLEGCRRARFPILREELEEVVARNAKQRFAFDASGELIRANQGHSVEIDLQLAPEPPPALLYHGTGQTSLESIVRSGLSKMNRHHVHLSTDVATAHTVGARHGKPVVLMVDAAAMREAGFLFFRSANGVWLVDHVPPEYLKTVPSAKAGPEAERAGR